ncbi:MAG TPA: hypothetical protein IAA61_01985 [Candidatus Ornithomonoglobus merdipullorum]|uniref:Bacterial repeat domain-containing protein n=1 Tax=Candidatus Ornithomonoglobus merdipullorum TaxID=2840895 RepID=A0A9D1MAA7_9FIRM|nr:hypothetical protein [Candidatus Ornithomonoglobus merdipullorum]
MIFKKFIGALTALVMTMTAFVGLATEVGAYTYDEQASPFNMYKIYLNNSDTPIYPENALQMITVSTPGNSFTYNDIEYVIDNIVPAEDGNSVSIYAYSAAELKINITGNGYVSIGGQRYNDNDTYSAATGSGFEVTVRAEDKNTIKSISINDTPLSFPENAPMWAISVENLKDGDMLNVTFGATYNITVYDTDSSQYGSVNVSRTTASAGNTITVYPTPVDGYEVDSVSYSYTDSNGEPRTESIVKENNSYTFTMPTSDVEVTVKFREIITLPNEVSAALVKEYDDEGSPAATLWEGTLNGYGNTSFKPSITVTLNAADEEAAQQKTVIGSTTVTGDSSIYLAIVVDQAKSAIDSVMLRGVTEDTDPTGGIYIDPSQSESDDSGEEVE